MKFYIVERLKGIDDVNKFISEKNIGEEYFDMCLMHHILNAQFRSNIFAIMQKYKREGCQLKQILGAIHLCSPTENYVHILIDLENKFIVTKDPMGMNEEMQQAVNGIHMNIAKAIGVGFNFMFLDKDGPRSQSWMSQGRP